MQLDQQSFRGPSRALSALLFCHTGQFFLLFGDLIKLAVMEIHFVFMRFCQSTNNLIKNVLRHLERFKDRAKLLGNILFSNPFCTMFATILSAVIVGIALMAFRRDGKPTLIATDKSAIKEGESCKLK
jgi:hypothetical protein